MEDWLKTTRTEKRYHETGITESNLYEQFDQSNSDYTPPEGLWDKKRFLKGFFELIQDHPDYEWNAHLAHKGSSKSDRRWQIGSRKTQEPWVKITDKS